MGVPGFLHAWSEHPALRQHVSWESMHCIGKRCSLSSFTFAGSSVKGAVLKCSSAYEGEDQTT